MFPVIPGRRMSRTARLFVVAAVAASIIGTHGLVLPTPKADSPRPHVSETPDRIVVLGGGGRLPPETHKQFLHAAGGESARIVIIPTADHSFSETEAEIHRRLWEKRGARAPLVFHAWSRAQANDPQLVAALENATGIWFGGGDQEILEQRYIGTAVEEALIRLRERGVTFGGTSAGTAFMSRVMIAGPGPKEGVGLDVLPGVVTDQHLIAKNRTDRFRTMVTRHPQLVGIAPDECSTAVIRVSNGSMTVRCVGPSIVLIIRSANGRLIEHEQREHMPPYRLDGRDALLVRH